MASIIMPAKDYVSREGMPTVAAVTEVVTLLVAKASRPVGIGAAQRFALMDTTFTHMLDYACRNRTVSSC